MLIGCSDSAIISWEYQKLIRDTLRYHPLVNASLLNEIRRQDENNRQMWKKTMPSNETKEVPNTNEFSLNRIGLKKPTETKGLGHIIYKQNLLFDI